MMTFPRLQWVRDFLLIQFVGLCELRIIDQMGAAILCVSKTYQLDYFRHLLSSDLTLPCMSRFWRINSPRLLSDDQIPTERASTGHGKADGR